MITAIVLTALGGVWTNPDFGASYQAFERRTWASRSSLEAEARKHDEMHRDHTRAPIFKEWEERASGPAHAWHGSVSSEERANGGPVYVARRQFGHRGQSTHGYRHSRGYGASNYYNNQYYNNYYGGYGYPYSYPAPYYYGYEYNALYQPYYYNYYWYQGW